MNAIYAITPLADCVPEVTELIKLHYDEIAERKDVIPLDPDWEKYLALEKAGILFFATVREPENNALIGYYVATIVPHMHYKTSLTAFTDIFFIRQDYRRGRVGYQLFKFVIDAIRQRGVQRFYASCKIKHDVGPMLERLGFTEIERNYAMVFDNEQMED